MTHAQRGSIAVVMVALAGAPAAAQPLTLDQVLQRAGAYVVDFQTHLSGIVAEERYVQRVSFPPPRTVGADNQERKLASDLLLIKPIGADRWVQFRDVYEVDGRPVHDRNERLIKLFLDPGASTAQQAEQIVTESARYNIGGVVRNINIPVLALTILAPENQRRFHFSRSTDRKLRLLGEPKLAGAAETWVVGFDESRRGTLIRTNRGRDLFTRGRFWIEAASGRVIASELIADDESLHGTIDVVYQPEPSLSGLVPAEMRELYDVRTDGSSVEGTAKYSRFRQFQVKVDERIAPVKHP